MSMAPLAGRRAVLVEIGRGPFGGLRHFVAVRFIDIVVKWKSGEDPSGD